MIKDRNIGFLGIFSPSKTLFYLKLVKFLCLGKNVKNVLEMAIFGCQIFLKYEKLMLIFQNNTILFTNKMDFETFIFEPSGIWDQLFLFVSSLFHICLRPIKHN